MSYNPSQPGPRGPTYDYDSYDIPSYPDHGAYRQPPPQQQRPPPQGRRAPQHGYGHGTDPRMRFPRRAPPPSSNQNLYDGSNYAEFESNDSQWPLNERGEPQARAPIMPQQAAQRGPPPRPQRPDYVPPTLEPPRQAPRVAPANRQYHQPPPPVHHGSGEWTGDGYAMPGAPPFALPQYPNPPPVPQGTVNPPRRPPLGPPPSARRGPSSYYSQLSSVHPIVEESDSMRGSIRGPSRASIASSNAIPIGIPDYYLDHRDSGAPSMQPTTPGSEYPPEESPVEPVPPLRFAGHSDDDPPREESPVDQQPALVRQASLGKRSKPTLTTVKSGDKMRARSMASNTDSFSGPGRANRDTLATESAEEIPMVFQTPRIDTSAEAGAAAPPAYAPSNESPTERTTASGFYDSSSEKSSSHSSGRQHPSNAQNKEFLGAAVPAVAAGRGRSPLARAPSSDYDNDPRVKEVLGNLSRGGALSPSPNNQQDADTLKPPTAGLASQRLGNGKRLPARLNVDSVRDAEARGSLTSLPDLIKRATRLASNLDRGRTASRLGMTEWLGVNASNDDLAAREKQAQRDAYLANNRRSGGSISDILASFPPPASNPGSRQGHRRSLADWRGANGHSALGSDSDAGSGRGKKGRRCCGMPLWLFILLSLILLALVAAAVIVPVVLVVLPKQNDDSGAGGDAQQQCAAKLTCANGGTALVSPDHACRCLCVNGYTGSSCETLEQAACTSIGVQDAPNATVGDALPRLFDEAQSRFGINLDVREVLTVFSSEDLSCQGENALVSFGGKSQRRSLHGQEEARAVEFGSRPTRVVGRQESSSATTSGAAAAVTSNGIVFESGTPSAPSSAPSASGSSSPSGTTSGTSPTSSSSSSASSSIDGVSSKTLDFARTALLFILQDSSSLSTATTAQLKLQNFFENGETEEGMQIDRGNVSLGNGWSADLNGNLLSSGNGTVVGGQGGS